MNQEKIGKFIAKLRQENNLTQQQLAQRLGITDRAISHWENGRSLPDVSLFKKLCEILGISINELISGERVSNNIKKSDENIINLLNENKRHKKRSKKLITILSSGIILSFIILFLIIKNICPKIDLYNFTIQPADPDKPYKLNKQISVDKRNVFYYGIDFAIFCNKEEKCFQVDDALRRKQISLNDFQDYLEKQIEYENYQAMRMWDGGTTIYKKAGIVVIYCNNINGNKDVYIGNDKMVENLNGEYCGHERNENESFIRTYKILSSTINKDDSEFNDVTLEQNNNIETVMINNSYLLIPGHTYEFSFLTFSKYEDNIKNIFNNSTLLRAIETDKEISEQINEEIIVNDDLESDVELNELEHVRMDIVEGTLTSKSAKVRITDFSNYKYSYGSDFKIEKKEGNSWKELPTKKPLLFTLMAYGPDINGNLEFDIDWEKSYGILSKGKYRIVKRALLNSETPCKNKCKEYLFSVEFNIE